MKVRRSQGFSLIEVMIALLIGLIIMLGVMQVFSASKASYSVTEGLSRVQENARFAMEAIERDVRMVGHFGCVNDRFRLLTAGELNSHFAPGSALDFSQSMQGYEASGTGVSGALTLASPSGGWTPALPAWISGLSPAPQAGSDIVVLRFLAPEGIPATGFTKSGSSVSATFDASKWSVLTQSGVANPSLFGVSDCTYADVFEATAVASGSVTTSQTALNTTAIDFDSRYTASPAGQTVLYRAEAVIYYVANNPNNIRSLYRARLLPPVGGTNVASVVPEEVVEGIESIQFLYGLDGSVDPARPSGHVGFQETAGSASLNTEQQWRRVGQVRLGVLAASPDASTSTQAAATRLKLLGTQVTAPNDRRYRTTYDAAVSLRNRLPSTN